jgi:hypothetical protein
MLHYCYSISRLSASLKGVPYPDGGMFTDTLRCTIGPRDVPDCD